MVRVVPCILLIVCCCLTLTGCQLFSNQSTGEGKRWPFTAKNDQNQYKKPAAPAPNPVVNASDSSVYTKTALAGTAVGPDERPVPNTYIRWYCLDEPDSKDAAIDIAAQSGGHFLIPNVERGKHYKLIARAGVGKPRFAKIVTVTAPHNNIYIKMRDDLVTSETPPIPPPPAYPPSVTQGPEKDENKASEGTSWQPDKGNKEKSAGNGLSFGAPVPLGGAGQPPPPPPSQWSKPPDSNQSPKDYPHNIVEGDPFKSKHPTVNIPPTNDKKLPSFPTELPPAPPGSNGQFSKDRPLVVKPALPNDSFGAHVPSCVLEGQYLKNMALPDFYGNPWEWRKDRLGRLVLMDFWFTGCVPCKDAIYFLRSLQAKYGPAGLEIIGIAAEKNGTIDEKRHRVAMVCQRLQTNYRLLMATGPNDPVLNQFNVRYFPTLVLVDANGEVLWKHEGGLDAKGWEALERYIRLRLGV